MPPIDSEKSNFKSTDVDFVAGIEQAINSVEYQSEFNIGTTFKCEDEAYDAYNIYAILKGFGVRKGKKVWCKSGLSAYYFPYSCEGISEIRDPHEEGKRERLEYRCGCKAQVKYQIIDGLWEVVILNDNHNHPMIDDKHKHFISSARNLTPAVRKILASLFDSGVGAKKTCKYMIQEAGGLENVGIVKQDVQNYKQSLRRDLIGVGVAKSLLDKFKDHQAI